MSQTFAQVTCSPFIVSYRDSSCNEILHTAMRCLGMEQCAAVTRLSGTLHALLSTADQSFPSQTDLDAAVIGAAEEAPAVDGQSAHCVRVARQGFEPLQRVEAPHLAKNTSGSASFPVCHVTYSANSALFYMQILCETHQKRGNLSELDILRRGRRSEGVWRTQHCCSERTAATAVRSRQVLTFMV